MPSRNRYVKIALAEPSTTNLMGGTVVGQYGDTLLVQRPDSKPRTKKAAAARKPRATKPETSAPAGYTSSETVV